MSSSGWVSPSPLPAARGFHRGNTSPSQAQSRSLLQQSPRAARVASPLPLPTSSPALPAVPSHGYRSSSHVETSKNGRRALESETEEAAVAQPSSQLTASPAPAPAARLSSSVSSTPSSSSPSSARSSGAAADHLSTSSPSPPTSTAAATLPPSSSSSFSQASGRADPSGWEDDDAVHECRGCGSRFSLFLRKHHCRQCGLIFCDGCSRNRRRVRGSGDELVRVCDRCDFSISRDEDDDRQRAAETALLHPMQPTPRSSPSPPPAAGSQQAEPTSASSAQHKQPHHQTSQSLASIPSVTLASSSSSSSAPSDNAAAAAADSGERSALVSALLDELLCAEAVLRHAKLVRDEMDATVMQLVTEIVEREREATAGPGTAAAAAGDSGKKQEAEAGAAGSDAEEEMRLLRCRVDELQRENARLRARLEQQTVR